LNSKADIVIISYNTSELTLKCIRSVYDTANNFISQIIVVDNYSTDDTIQKINKHYPDVKIIVNPKNYGYAKAVNIGVRASNEKYLIISNPDVIYHQDSIKILIEAISKDNSIGVAGPCQLFPNGKWQRSFGDLPSIKLGLKDLFLITHIQQYLLRKNPPKNNLEVEYIDGAVMAFRRELFDKVDGFDEDYFFYTEEADFCHHVRKLGLKNIHIPNSVVTHLRGATTKKNEANVNRIKMLIESKALYCKKNLNFQNAKFFIILQIFYSLNMLVFWSLISLFNKNRKYKQKTFSHFYKIWLKEFEKFLGSYAK
jgi:hypothetical protein